MISRDGGQPFHLDYDNAITCWAEAEKHIIELGSRDQLLTLKWADDEWHVMDDINPARTRKEAMWAIVILGVTIMTLYALAYVPMM